MLPTQIFRFSILENSPMIDHADDHFDFPDIQIDNSIGLINS